MNRDDLDRDLDRDLAMRLGRFLEGGPERASRELVEATFRPVPLMRQRRRWGLRLAVIPTGPLTRALTVAAAIVVLVSGGLALGSGRLGGIVGGPAPSPSPSASTRPTFTITVAGGRSERYVSTPSAGLSLCHVPDTGAWSFLYQGGSPFASIDLVVPDGAATAPGSDRVAAEIEVDTNGPDRFYVRFDPAQIRGGDPRGRSQASVHVVTSPSEATVVFTVTTPDHTAGDAAPVTIDMTLQCPR